METLRGLGAMAIAGYHFSGCGNQGGTFLPHVRWADAGSYWQDAGMFQYAFGRVGLIKDAKDTTVSTFTYLPTGSRNLQQVLAPGGRVLTFGYDVAGRTRTVTRPLAVAESTYYDRLNRPTVVATTISGTRYAATTEYDNIYPRGTIDPKETGDQQADWIWHMPGQTSAP